VTPVYNSITHEYNWYVTPVYNTCPLGEDQFTP